MSNPKTSRSAEELYIGLMSGTSMDGIDAVLIELHSSSLRLHGHYHMDWPDDLRIQLKSLAQPGGNDIEQLCTADTLAADCFAEACMALLRQCNVDPSKVEAIGSHGQTVRHRPSAQTPFTLQIGNPNQIAEKTGITVVADFRRRDIAAGGEGAPLVPAFHVAQFSSATEDRIILNLGGIANITHIPADNPDATSGFDTGPANTLLDYWVDHKLGKKLDQNGEWAAQGETNDALLELMMQDPYFLRKPPKSTGPEHFSPTWLHGHLENFPKITNADIQATLTALTAESIKQAIEQHTSGCKRIIACGGGVYNQTLMKELSSRLAGVAIDTSQNYGIDPSHVEAIAFAWLARQTLHRQSGNLPNATGAKHPAILGGIYPA